MLEIVQLMGRDRSAAPDSLRVLLEHTKAEADSSITAWDVGQCLELLAQLEADAGNFTAAAELDESLGEMGHLQTTQWHYSSALAYARAALHRFKSGEIERAM